MNEKWIIGKVQTLKQNYFPVSESNTETLYTLDIMCSGGIEVMATLHDLDKNRLLSRAKLIVDSVKETD